MIDTILQTIKENSMIQENDKIVVAVSGGPDSMCLVHILNTLKEKLKISLAVAHVNHCLRGKDADEDENFVKKFCDQNCIGFYSIRVDINKLAKEKNISSEMAGRLARYEFFDSVRRKVKANKIAIAHNANDQAETILMRIMRGTGSEGLVGIRPVRDRIFIRPLINTTRREIENYCKKCEIDARIDNTNLQNIYSRNKVRLELIPYIKENFNQDIVSVLNRLSCNMRTDNEYLDNISKKNCKLYCEKNGEKVIIKKEVFLEHEAILTRVIRKAIIELLGSTYNIERKNVIDIIEIQKHKSGVSINLPNNINVYNNYGDIIIYFNNEKKAIDTKEYELIIDKRNVISNKNLNITISLLDQNQNIDLRKNDFIKYFDYDKINGKIVLRYRRDGDRFTNIGMNGSKKLKDMFIDMKIEKDKRNNIPLICFGSEIAWIVGYNISDKFKVEKNTKKILQIKFESEEKVVNADIKEIIYTEEQIRGKIKEIGKKISEDYKGRDLLLVGILKGSVMFMADLMKEINIPCSMDFMAVSSYGASTKSSGIVKIIKDLDFSIQGKDVLIVEDIIDSGTTLAYLQDYLKSREPNSLEIASLLSKPDRRKVEIKAKYIGFDVPDFFLVGYGLDYAERYRNLPYIGILKQEIYE